MKHSNKDRRTDAASSIILPLDFSPGMYEVIIGRGRRCTEHYGNLRFKSIIDYELEGYSAAECKRQKSSIIGRVLGLVKQQSPAGFVKKDIASGRWLSLNQAASRVTIAQAFRDACQDSYRSSKKSKQVKRKIQKKALEAKETTGPVKSDGQTQPPLLDDSLTLKEEETLDLDLEIGEDFFEEHAPLAVIQEEEPKLRPQVPVDLTGEHVEVVENSPVVSESAFESLFEAFAGNADLNDNPYEPIPLAPVQRELQQQYFIPLTKESKKEKKRQKMEHQAGRFSRPIPSRTVCAAMSA